MSEELILDPRVLRGIGKIDETGEEGWREKLRDNVDIIDVRNASNCPLGIIFGTYREGMMRMGISIDKKWITTPRDLGLLMSSYGFDTEDGVERDFLSNQWKKFARSIPEDTNDA